MWACSCTVRACTARRELTLTPSAGHHGCVRHTELPVAGDWAWRRGTAHPVVTDELSG